MFASNFVHSVTKAFHEAGIVASNSLGSIKRDPQIAIYPYLAVLFVLITFPLVNGLVFIIWNHLAHNSVFSISDNTPHRLRIILGLVTFSFFYTIFISAYFTCAVSADVLTKLEGRQTPRLYGLRLVFKRFFRVTKFAVLAIFFFPLGIIAQYRKLRTPRGIVEVIGSSLSLQIAQLAPAILTENKGFFATVRHSLDTLGKAWHENLVLKIGMRLCLLILISLAFLPRLIEHYWFDGGSAHIVSWLASALLGASSFIAVNVVGSVFTTTIYYRVVSKQNK